MVDQIKQRQNEDIDLDEGIEEDMLLGKPKEEISQVTRKDEETDYDQWNTNQRKIKLTFD